jgi:beta-galactosidase
VKTKVADNFYENWHFISAIYNGQSLKLYIDEEEVASKNFRGNISVSPFPLCIGREAEKQDQGEFSGRLSKMIIDEVRIFNTAVSMEVLKTDTANAVLYLDFENDKKEGDFYAVGLGGRTYGIVWPDRQIQPEIYQIKKSGQPIHIEMLDVEAGIIKVTNRHHFKNLNEFDGIWEITVDGDTIQRGFFEMDLAAGKSVEDTIEFRTPNLESEKECILTISFVTKETTNWAEAGHEVAWEQFVVPTPALEKKEEMEEFRLSARENYNELTVTGSGFKYVFDKKTGQIVSLNFNGTEYLEGGPNFNVWRAPLANDIDPWGSSRFKSEYITPGLGRSIDNQLRTLGMKELVSEADEIEVLKRSKASIKIKMKVFSNSTRKFEYGNVWLGASSAFERNEVWTIFPDGTIELEQEIIPGGPMPGMLQKIGLQFELPKQFSNVEWYGRGPFENYPDRKTGAKIGRYSSNASEMYVPYIFPQDYGNRSDVRWLKVENNEGKGLMIRGEDELNFSLHKFTTDNLDRAVYTYQLEEAPHTILNVDYEVSGVGGTAIRQMQRYRVMPRAVNYKLTIKPY